MYTYFFCLMWIRSVPENACAVMGLSGWTQLPLRSPCSSATNHIFPTYNWGLPPYNWPFLHYNRALLSYCHTRSREKTYPIPKGWRMAEEWLYFHLTASQHISSCRSYISSCRSYISSCRFRPLILESRVFQHPIVISYPNLIFKSRWPIQSFQML